MSQWKRCPDCRALMARMGTDDPHRLEDLFLERLAGILREHGKRPAVWNEAVRTGAFSHDCRVNGWESTKACLDATAKGYRTVVMPGEYFYFDMRQSPNEPGHQWAAIFDARKVYSFDFAEAGFSAAQMRRVEGLQGAFFSELYVAHEPEKPDYLDYMLFPRVCALARIAWSGNDEGWDAYYKEPARGTLPPHDSHGHPLPSDSAAGTLRRRDADGGDRRRLAHPLRARRPSGRGSPTTRPRWRPPSRTATGSARSGGRDAAPMRPTIPATARSGPP